MQNERSIPSILVYCDITSGGGVYVYTKALMGLLGKEVRFFLLTHEPITKDDYYRLDLLSAYSSQVVFIKNGLSQQCIFSEIVSSLASLKPTFYIPNYRDAPHAAIIASKKAGCKTIFIAHNDHYEQYKFAVRYQDNIDYFLSPSIKCDLILKEILKAKNGARCFYIPHFIESPNIEFQKDPIGGPVKLLYNGRITFEQKQLYYLAEVASEFLKRKLDFHINIVGDGESRNALEKKFKDLGVDSTYFTFHGYIPHEDLPPHFIDNDLVLLVSSYEGFCLGLAEAMSYGLPAVAFSCGGVIDDYLSDGLNGLIIAQGDVKAFADGVQHLVNDKELFLAMSNNAKSTIKEKFNSEIVTSGYKNIFFDSKISIDICWPSIRPVLLTSQENIFLHLIERTGCLFFGWKKLFKIALGYKDNEQRQKCG